MNARHAGARAFAWAGAALFVAALGYFLFSYAVTFGETAAGTGARAAIAIDISLFSAFALHHSLFARDRVRALVRQLVSDQLERSVYVWVASLMLIGVCYAWQPVAGVAWRVDAPWSWLLHALQAAGAWLTLRSVRVIDGLELAGLRPPPSAPAPGAGAANPFKSEGPYRWVRHPIYLGWILITFGMPTMTMTRLVFAVVAGVYLLAAIPLEERTLRAHAGGAYEDYMRRVPWKLIPGLL